MPFIQVNDNTLIFRLRRSRRAKRLHMLVRQHLFEVVAPHRVSNAQVLAFVWQHRSWMVKQWRRKGRHTSTLQSVWPENFFAGETILYRGERLMLNVKYGAQSSVQLQAQRLTVTLSWQSISAHQIAASIKAQVIAWYQQEAKQLIQASLEEYCPRLGRHPRGFSLKQQKTRWGSCGIQENIHINWLLVLAPPGVLEYVVVHELCHLFHRNHGKRFWAKVAQFYPQYEQHEAWLRNHGQYLQPLN